MTDYQKFFEKYGRTAAFSHEYWNGPEEMGLIHVSVEDLYQAFEARVLARMEAEMGLQGKLVTWEDMEKFFHEQYGRKTR